MDENINKLNAVLSALNHIDTHGKQNLLNLGAAIEIIEGVVADLRGSDKEEEKE